MDPIKISTSCNVGKSMPTKVDGPKDAEIVTCSITLSKIRMARETAETLGGYAIDTWRSLYDDKGYPRQRAGILLPKRELIVDLKVEQRNPSGATLFSIAVPLAAITGLQFTLDAPDDEGETVVMHCVSVWKAAGDEVEDVKPLLGKPCFLIATFKEPPTQAKLFSDSKASATAEAAAAKRNAAGVPDRKSQAAGEKVERPPHVDPPDELLDDAMRFASILDSVSISELQAHLKIGYNRAARILECMEIAGYLGPMATGRRTVHADLLSGKVAADAKAAPAPPDDKPVKVTALVKGTSMGKSTVLVGKNFEREARDLAARKPRREPAKTKGDTRGNDKRKR
jgi:hypothetical protein